MTTTTDDPRTMDRALKVRVLQSVISSLGAGSQHHRNPGLVLPDIAHRHSLTLDAVKTIVQAHGWPRVESMRRAVQSLADGHEPQPERPTVREGSVVDTVAGEQELRMIDVDDLVPDPDNAREDLGELTELANSIRDLGILQPVVARQHGQQIMIVMGHRRRAAAILAGLREIPVIVRSADMDPDEVLAAMIVENGQRLGLDPIEEARALARLKRTDDMSDALLGERISKSQPYVSGRLALLSLTPAQQAAVRAGTLSLARAVKLGRDQGGITRPNAQGKASAAHLDWNHPLAEKASILCQHNRHSKHQPGRPGGVACGSCWEDVIRADERDRIDAGAQP